jgi:hypothetical protein
MHEILDCLINNVVKRKGHCCLLDLGSGAPGFYGSGSHGSFKATAKARQAGKNVTLTAVDVIWPPLSLKTEDYDAKFDFKSLAQELNNNGVECVGIDFNEYVKCTPKRFDIIVQREVYGVSVPGHIYSRGSLFSRPIYHLLNLHGYIVPDDFTIGAMHNIDKNDTRRFNDFFVERYRRTISLCQASYLFKAYICPKWRSFAVFQKEELNNDGYIDVLPVDSELEID